VDRLEDLGDGLSLQVNNASVAVVGAGWAGMAAAASLAGRGVPVTVFEASRHLGGRARRVALEGVDLDNGQHILIGAYREALAMMRKVGADPEKLLLRLPLEIRYADGFHLRAPRLPYPFNLLFALLGARGLGLGQAALAIRFMRSLEADGFRVVPDRPVSRWLEQNGQSGALRSHLWEPLCVSALNTPAHAASAQVFAAVLRDGLTGSREASDLLLARTDLGALFPEPAAAYVKAHGGAVELGAPVRAIARDGKGLSLDGREQSFASVIVATGPQHAAALLAGFAELAGTRATIDALEYEPIMTCYLQYPESVSLPCPMLGLGAGVVQWVFDRARLGGPKGLLAAVVSASGAHEELSSDALAAQVETELKSALGALPPRQWCRVITEKRATFSCRPGLARPVAVTAVPGLLLAGDYVASEHPGTLESAVRSGIAAAGLAVPA
jgi:squalene-associated FAD-dependent desaturase